MKLAIMVLVIVACLPLVVIVGYLLLSMCLWIISVLHGDYPGPKVLYSNKDRGADDAIDWLLIHGASVDARSWSNFLNRHPDAKMAAISLAGHERGVVHANPNAEAAIELAQYLSTHKVRCGIVGHSTAALWIADAYSRCPECFQGLQVILITPNFGSNIILAGFDQLLFKVIHKIAWLLAMPIWKPGKMNACIGAGDQRYALCSRLYMYDRLYNFISLNYYHKLLTYGYSSAMQHKLRAFLDKFRENITIYATTSDLVLDPVETQALAKAHQIELHLMDNIPHHMMLDQDACWFAQS